MTRRALLLLALAVSIASAGHKTITIDLSKQELIAKEGNKIFLKAPVSTGRYGHPTPNGKFKIFGKVKDNKSTLYPIRKNGKRGGAKMPYTMRVVGSVAIHEGYIPRSHGKAYPDSHGCIRVPKSKAKKLYAWTNIGTRVNIVGKPKYHDSANSLRKKYLSSSEGISDGDVAARYQDEFHEWGESYENEGSLRFGDGDMDYIGDL